MRKLIVLSFISLDGVLQAPGGPDEDPSGGFKFGGWLEPLSDEVVGDVIREQMGRPYELLLGRVTFDIWAAYWPQHREHDFGINQAKKYVVSRTVTHHTWENSIFLNGDAAEEVKKLKSEDGPELQVQGSGNLIQTLLKHDLVDELWLKIFPVTLGSGKRLFGSGTIPKTFALTASKISPAGAIIANFKRAGEVATGRMGPE